MGKSVWIGFVVVVVTLAGCPRSHPSDAATATDAGMDAIGAVDVLPGIDAPRALDVRRRPDVPRVADERLTRLRRCGLTEAEALHASVAHAALYSHIGAPTSPHAVYESWQAGAFWGLTAASDWDIGCDAWRCYVSARTVIEAISCEEIHGPCDVHDVWCDDGVLHDCRTGRDRAFSCAELGATCQVDHCQLDDCYITPFGEVDDALRCVDGDVTLCNGAMWTDCEAEVPGSTCDYLRLGDVLPLVACRPSGVYATHSQYEPIDCEDGVLRFTSVYGDAHTYDCLANGYAGCDVNGCILTE